ncbi:MAG: prolyl aminopeptidase [Alphaproteobacteria bacterium]|nr:prolyl aminopeptidase [Alphaproteobacteria bacterium]
MPAHDAIRRTELYPPLDPFASGFLAVDSIHRIYWEESGNPAGIPVLFLHGGPGAGATPAHRRFFDPAVYRIVIFDQRGSGRSTPHGEVRANTTPLLVADIERLRRERGIDRFVLFGGSWGSTLALAYAQAHPECVRGLVLRGIFLSRESELEWFLYGMRTVFPEAWRAFAEFLPPAERRDLLTSYHRRLVDPDPAIHMPAARAWSTFEGSCSTLMPSMETVASFGEDHKALGLARIEAHYFINGSFLREGQLLEDVGRIREIPAVIVQGRYDMVCPIVSADDLARAWPEAQYTIVPDAGHSAMEPGIRAALVGAMERFKRLA